MANLLLLRCEHVLDPGTGIDQELDILISGSEIVEVGPRLEDPRGTRLIELRGQGRIVVPGLIDIHTHIAFGATTIGVGMQSCTPDQIGVESGVTTLVDCGSVGVASVGVFPAHVIPNSKTRIVCYLNAGSFAHTMPGMDDISSLRDIDRNAIAACLGNNPKLVGGLKLRLTGQLVQEQGELLIDLVSEIAREHRLPLMVHIGEMRGGDRDRSAEITKHALRVLATGDILTHLCTPREGGVMDRWGNPFPEVAEARARGLILDSGMGSGNFDFEIAKRQADIGLGPDTISTDLVARLQTYHSLVECMAKFMAVGYSLADVIRMTTSDAARSIGMGDRLGAIAVGREADLTVLDIVDGAYSFLGPRGTIQSGGVGIAPVLTVRAGEVIQPGWGPHPWGWLPTSAEASA